MNCLSGRADQGQYIRLSISWNIQLIMNFFALLVAALCLIAGAFAQAGVGLAGNAAGVGTQTGVGAGQGGLGAAQGVQTPVGGAGANLGGVGK